MLRRHRLAIVLAGLTLAVAGLLAPYALGQATAPLPDNTAAAIGAYRQAVVLFDQKKLADAQAMVNRALVLDPDLPDALLLRSQIEAAAPRPAPSPAAVAATQVYFSPPDQLLTAAQVNRVRLSELTDAEVKAARGIIAAADVEDFWKNIILKDPNETAISAQDRARFISPANFTGQLTKIRDQHALAFYDKVKLTTDPAGIRVFVRRTQPYILQNCATSGCHGGETAVVFRLYGNPTGYVGESDAETCTNMLVLSTFASGGHGLVDRAAPDQSLVLQYMLPRRDATLPHPNINGRDVVLQRLAGPTDPRYREILEWVKSLKYPQPNYEIKYTIVARPAATQPATGPATRSRPR